MAIVASMPYFIKEIGNTTQLRGYSGSMLLGAFAGSIAGGKLADQIGRKALMTSSSVLFLVGSVFQTGGDNSAIMYCGRVLTGFCVGIYSMLVPLYQSEIAPKQLRGRLITCYQYAITLGIFCASWISYGTKPIDNGSSWRIPMGVQVIPCLILLILIYFIPESPRYLMYRNHDSDALIVLSKLHGDGSSNHPDVYMEYVAMKQTITYEKTFKNYASYSRLFSGPPEDNRRRLLLGILTQIFQQLTGINPILLFAPQALHASGLNVRDTSLFADCIGTSINMVATIPAIFFIDKFGRRSTMLVGASLLCICLIIMSVLSIVAHFLYGGDYSSLDDRQDNFVFEGQTKREAIAFVCMEYIYVAVFAYTWGNLGWVYPSELYNQGVRAKALSITNGFGWLLNFAVFEFYTPMLSNTHGRSFIVFACCCATIVVVVYFYFPETKGKSLEEIDLIFGCDIGYYSVDAHHPQTAAATLVHMEKIQRKNASKYPFQIGNCGPLYIRREDESNPPPDTDDSTLHPTSVIIQHPSNLSNTSFSVSSSTSRL
ncbi:hypothetical protein [Absidia glauca]|uniref:Major facilitator superfamily (MFS) profile domain-containing protein n=1 Tax=Absidia glauca TaxID=4829 RepID=A0A163KTC7_ABSGL|nr:hypothetical protein [Absidia glauca]